jgi:lipoyl-dependent peroxiredoxin
MARILDRRFDMAISRYATAHWEGDLKTGKGLLDTPAS